MRFLKTRKKKQTMPCLEVLTSSWFFGSNDDHIRKSLRPDHFHRSAGFWCLVAWTDINVWWFFYFIFTLDSDDKCRNEASDLCEFCECWSLLCDWGTFFLGLFVRKMSPSTVQLTLCRVTADLGRPHWWSLQKQKIWSPSIPDLLYWLPGFMRNRGSRRYGTQIFSREKPDDHSCIVWVSVTFSEKDSTECFCSI